MVSNITEDIKQEIRNAFDYFDDDGSGKLSRDEIADVIRGTGLNPTADELEEMFQSIDTDGSGEIEYEEFEEYYIKTFSQSGRNEQKDLLEAFQTFDRDGNGFLDVNELKEALTKSGKDPLSDDEIKEMIAKVDVDKDGMINYTEFVQLMNPHPSYF